MTFSFTSMGTASRRNMCSALYVYNADLSYSRIFNQTRTVAIALVCDRKRIFGETPKPKISNLKRWNFTETVITAVRDIFSRKLKFWSKIDCFSKKCLFR